MSFLLQRPDCGTTSTSFDFPFTVLRGGYDGYCTSGPLDGSFPDDFPSELDGGGYDSDSDLEDDDEQAPHVNSSSVAGSSSSSAVLVGNLPSGDSDGEKVCLNTLIATLII